MCGKTIEEEPSEVEDSQGQTQHVVVVELNDHDIWCPLAQSVEHAAVKMLNKHNSSLTEKSVSDNPANSVKSKSRDRTTPSKESQDFVCRDFTRDT